MTPFDDLESIFYILAWNIFGHKQPLLKDHRLAMRRIEGPLSNWFGETKKLLLADTDVANMKKFFFLNYSEIKTVREAWLPLLPLLNLYHKVLHEREIVLLQREEEGRGVDLETLSKDAIDAFDKILGYFTQTLESVEMANNGS
jgi:hypothetical protein